MMKRRNFVVLCIIVLVAAILGVMAGRGKIHFKIFEKAKDHVAVRMTEKGFDPKRVSLYQGNEVCFVNTDAADHWPMSDMRSGHKVYPEFDAAKAVAPGDEWCFPFDLSGTWRFHDQLHPELTGTVDVKDKH